MIQSLIRSNCIKTDMSQVRAGLELVITFTKKRMLDSYCLCMNPHIPPPSLIPGIKLSLLKVLPQVGITKPATVQR